MKNYEMKIEQHERYYRVIFTPDTNYGNIGIKVYNRDEAYAKYHELKNIVYSTRPGRLKLFEYILDETGNYREVYMANCRTGREVDTIAIFNNIDKELQQISRIYNGNKMEAAKDNNSKEQLNIMHGVEYVDMTQLSVEQKLAILDKMQIVSSLRRQAKNEQQDYKDIADDLIKMKASLKTIERKLRDNLAFRKKSVDQNGASKKAGTQIKLETYLESLGLNPQDFLEN